MTRKTPGARPKGHRAPKDDAAVAQPAEHRASTPKASGSTPAGRSRPDWDAIEASHRTGRYSDGQLAELFKVSREAIVRKRKKDQAEDPKRWQKDLREQVRQTTAALVAADAVRLESQQGHIKVTDVIVAAAEQAKDVILRQRSDIARYRSLADKLLDEVAAQTVDPQVFYAIHERITEDMEPDLKKLASKALRDALEVHGRVASMAKLADTLTKLQNLERKAFHLDDPGEKPPADAPDPATVTRDTAVDTYRQMVNG